MNDIFFFDTCILLEIIKGNKKYAEYKEAQCATALINIAELNYILKKEHSEAIANKITDYFKECIVLATWSDMITAGTIKRKNKELSLPDAIGYAIAQRLHIPFLTSDSDFKDLPNVEFVTKERIKNEANK